MTQNDSTYCVYGHYTKDTNELFYIGIGRQERAISKKYRNKYWHNIVNSHGYIVKLLVEGITRDCACSLEIQFINEFNPKCNFTKGGDGGDTTLKLSKEVLKDIRERQSKSMLGKGKGIPKSKDHRDKLTNNSRCKKVRCIETGVSYSSIAKCARDLKLDSQGVAQAVRKKCKCKGYSFELVNE